MTLDTTGSSTADNESSHAIYGEAYGKMEEIRMQQPGAVSEESIARQEVALALDAVGKNLRPGDRVLDCPCGLGMQAEVLAQYRNDLQITAMDASSASIETAKARQRAVPVRFIQGFFNQMRDNVGLNSQRAVFCFKESFGYGDTVEENMDHLKSMFDVLLEDGQMVLTWNFNPDDFGMEKLIQPINGETVWGKDEQGRTIGAYVSVEPPKKEAQVIPEKYIPDNGFDALHGDSPQAISNRTVSSFKRVEYVYIGPDGQEVHSGPTEVRKYLKPVIESVSSGKNAPLESDNRFYDIPLIRALCEYAGFEDVKCIPAKELNDRNWTIGIVATKPKQDVTVSDLQAEQAHRLNEGIARIAPLTS